MKPLVVLTMLLSQACLCPAQAAERDLELRQIVIRAPELEVVGLMADPAQKSGAEIHAALLQAIQAGRASLVSDITSAAEDQLKTQASQGRHVWLVTERDQDMDRLYLPPTSFQEFFVGASLEASLKTGNRDEGVHTTWAAKCSPCGPALTQWPTSWLRIYTRDHKPDPQKPPLRGWLDNYDLFTEAVVTDQWFEDSKMHVLAVTPPGDQMWPGEQRPGRWLDVFFAQVKPAEREPPFPEVPKEEIVPRTPNPDPFGNAGGTPALMQVMVYGIGLDAGEAMALMAERKPEDDSALLQRLLARVREGRARLHVCAGLSGKLGNRSTVNAGRMHQYPSEMPSIPSAWTERLVGTSLETDGIELTLRQDIGPPRRTEWRLAVDDPKAVMWQPRFRSLNVSASLSQKSGVHLLSLQRIPEVMTGNGIANNETLLLFVGRNKDIPLLPGNVPAPTVETEILVLEVPGAEPADFEGLPGDPLPDGDDLRFQQFMDRMKTGEVRMVAHHMVCAPPGRSSEIYLSEEFVHATEFDPPDTKASPRMRPTALEVVHAGDLWDLETTDYGRPTINVATSFKHTTGTPVEPGLEAILAAFAKDEPEDHYPAMEHPMETWELKEGLELSLDKAFCLGFRKPPGTQRKVLHVAYIRLRELR